MCKRFTGSQTKKAKRWPTERLQSVRHRWGILALTWPYSGRTAMLVEIPDTNSRPLDLPMNDRRSVSAHVRAASRDLKLGRKGCQAVHAVKCVQHGLHGGRNTGGDCMQSMDVKRALLGDKEAAKRLTNAGVLVPCPRMRGCWCRVHSAKTIINTHWKFAVESLTIIYCVAFAGQKVLIVSGKKRLSWIGTPAHRF